MLPLMELLATMVVMDPIVDIQVIINQINKTSTIRVANLKLINYLILMPLLAFHKDLIHLLDKSMEVSIMLRIKQLVREPKTLVKQDP